MSPFRFLAVLVLHSRPGDDHHQQQAEDVDGDVPFAAGER